MSSARPRPQTPHQHIMQPHKQQRTRDQVTMARQSETSPFASIVIPVYNHEKYLGAALDSVLAQTDPSWEAIVVNDGSTDGTAEIANDYAARDSRIHVIHKANGGVASALNAGLKAARGKWIHWLSSDDMFEPTKLELNRRWISANPGARFFFSYFTLLRQDTGIAMKHDLWGPIPEPQFQILTLLYRNYISGITICIERAALREVGLFDESLHYSQDFHLWLRVLEKYRGVFIPEWTVINRNHPEQGSEVFPLACLYDTAKAAVRFVNNHPFPTLVPWSDLSDFEEAHAAVMKALWLAMEPTSFIYCLGPQPGLILRLLEWLYSDGIEPNFAEILRDIVLRRIRQEALSDGNDDWHVMWRTVAAACACPEPNFRYASIDPIISAATLHARDRQAQSAHALRTYLERFEGVIETGNEPSRSGKSRIVIVVPKHASAAFYASLRDVAMRLCLRGYLPILLSYSEVSLTWEKGFAEIALHDQFEDQLPWLGEVDIAVWFDSEPSIWIEARRSVVLRLNEDMPPDDLMNQLLNYLDETPASERTPVVLFELSLWAGGAERVVHDIAGRLDRRRYSVYVVTLIDGPLTIEMPPGVQHLRIQNVLDTFAQEWKENNEIILADGAAFSTVLKTISDAFLTALSASAEEQVRTALPIVASWIDDICEQRSAEHSPAQAVSAVQAQNSLLQSIGVLREGRETSAYDHFVKVGYRKGLVPSKPVVDEAWYLQTYPDIATAIREGRETSAYDHFVKFGCHERRMPSKPVVDEAWYPQAYPDVATASREGQVTSAYDHFVKFGYLEGRMPSKPVVDEAWYLQTYKAVEIATGAITQYALYAAALREILANIAGKPTVISIMESQAVVTWACALISHLHFIASIHIFESGYFPVMHPDPLTCELEWFLFEAACQAAQRATVPCADCAVDLAEHFDVDRKKIEVHSNPINCARVRRYSWAEPERVLATGGKFVFIHVGRLYNEKNHDLLIDTCAHLAKERDDFVVQCVGSGIERNRLLKRLEVMKLDRFFTFIEHTPNPFPYIRGANALVLTSKLESFALVLVEAMVCGVPIVSVDCPVGPREVLDDGRFGILTRFNDPIALAEAMARLIDDGELRRRLARDGLKRAADFDVSLVVRDWERLIDETACDAGRHFELPVNAAAG